MSKFVIFDGNAIVHRAYHGIPPLTTKEGIMVNAVYGFASMMLKVLHDLKPDYIAVTFDMAGGSTARLARYEKYKATRVKADQALYDQIPLVHHLVEAFGYPIYEKGGYEADDVIGTVVKKIMGHKNDIETFIVTGDMDALQLVDEHTRVYTLRKGMSDIVVYDPATITARFGFGPELMIDYKAIRGDTSDNIPGVPGIGEKGATELIQKVGGIEEIYKKISKLNELGFKDGLIKKLEDGKENALMSRALAAIDCDVPDLGFALEDCKIKPFDREKIIAMLRRFEFFSLLKRIPGMSEVETESGKQTAVSKKKKIKFEYQEIKSADEVTALFKLIKERGSFACQKIVTGAELFSTQLTGLLMVTNARGYWVGQKFLEKILPIFAEVNIELVGHDLKPLIKELRIRGVEVKNKLFDVMIASYLLNPGSRAHDAAAVALKTLGVELKGASGQESLFGADYRALAEELYYIATAGEQLRQELADADNAGLLEKIEMPTLLVLSEMELNGIAVDTKKLADLSERIKKEIDSITKKIYTHAGGEFNIASPLQLREVLFEKLDIPVEGIKKGKTGLSTSAEQLEKMRGLHPIIEEIEVFRELSKLQNTYVDVLPALINPTTHRIHTTFNQAVAATGRLSSVDPNLQNIPIRTELGREIREAFIAEKGNVLMSADYSQIELRIVASLAQDKRMIEIFEKGEDIHTATAAAIQGVPLDKVTKDMRRAAKEVNFGVLYGMGTHGLSWRAGISYQEAKEFIAKYFQEFNGVKKYLEQTIEFTKKEGYCETLFGRRRYIPELTSSNYQLRAAGERMAVNHPIQGTAADLMKLGMIAVYEEIKKRYPAVILNPIAGVKNLSVNRSDPSSRANSPQDERRIKMVLQVHDELVLEIPKDMVKEVGQMVKEKMESVATLRVPIEVHVSSGPSWGEMK